MKQFCKSALFLKIKIKFTLCLKQSLVTIITRCSSFIVQTTHKFILNNYYDLLRKVGKYSKTLKKIITYIFSKIDHENFITIRLLQLQ